MIRQGASDVRLYANRANVIYCRLFRSDRQMARIAELQQQAVIEGATIRQMSDLIVSLNKRINRLEQWIAEDGINSDTCTFEILNVVCGNCQCKRKVL